MDVTPVGTFQIVEAAVEVNLTTQSPPLSLTAVTPVETFTN